MVDQKSGNLTGIWVALFALFGIFALPSRVASPPSPAPSASAEKPANEAKEGPASGPRTKEPTSEDWLKILSPLKEFRASFRKPNSDSESLPLDCVDCEIGELLQDDSPVYRLDLMIAAVPDPARFVGKDWFDSIVDAIQRATEAQDFVLDRYRLPQGRQETLPAGTTRVLLGNNEPPAAEVGPPGMLLFRDTSDQNLNDLRLILPTSEAADKKREEDGKSTGLNNTIVIDRIAGAICIHIYNRQGLEIARGRNTETPPSTNFKERMVELEGILQKIPPGQNPTPKQRHEILQHVEQLVSLPQPPVRLLGVLLVPESPTNGLDKSALKVAFSIVQRHQMLSKELVQPIQIRIVGPNYSGSQTSMEQAMSSWLATNARGEKQVDFNWCSGTASSIAVDRLNLGLRGGTAHFSATVHQSKQIDRTMLKYIADRLSTTFSAIRGPDETQRIAFLVESNTEFGTDVMSQSSAIPSSDGSWRLTPTSLAEAKVPKKQIFPFPMRISQLRVAYSRKGILSGAKAVQLPSIEQLSQPFEGGGHGDVLPSNSPEASASNDELAITQILTQIERQKYPYVAILATEREDTLFLARLVRHHCPDARLILLNIATAYWHPDNIRALRGALVISDYPLNPRNQSWSYPYRGELRQLGMPSEWAQGTYNAVTFQLCDLLSAGAQLKGRLGHRALLEYGEPFDESEGKVPPSADSLLPPPPVWISVIGQHGFYPLATESDDSNAKYMHPLKSEQTQSDDNEPPLSAYSERQAPMLHQSWVTVYLIASIALLVMNLFYLSAYVMVRILGRGQPSGENGTGRSGEMQLWRWVKSTVEPWAGGPRSERLPHHWRPWRAKRALVLIRFLLLTFLYGFLVSPVLIPYRIDKNIAWVAWLPAAGAIIVLCTSIVALLISVRMMIFAAPSRPPSADGTTPPEPWWVLIACILFAVAAAAVDYAWPPDVDVAHKITHLLFCERAMVLTSGVSPLMPMLFVGLGFLAWSGGCSSRLALAQRTTQAVPLRRGGSPILQEIARQAKSIRLGILPLLSGLGTMSWWALMAVIAVALAPLALLGMRIQRTDETWWFDLLFWLGFSTVLLLAWVGLLDLFIFWKKLLDLLRLFVALPMTRALDRLPARIGAHLGQPRGPFPAQENSLAEHQCAALLEGFDEVEPFLRKCKTTDPKFLEALHRTKTRASLHRPRALVRRPLIGLLLPFWKRRPVAIAFSETRSNDDRAKSADVAPYWTLGHEASTPHTGTKNPPGSDDAETARHWLDQAEDLVALTMVDYVSPYFSHLWDLVAASTLTPLLLFLAITSYHFQPMRYCLALLGTTIVFAVALLLMIFVQMNRNEFVSRISSTTPHRLTLDRSFLLSLVQFVLPLIAILVALSTDLTDLTRSWFDPVLEMLG